MEEVALNLLDLVLTINFPIFLGWLFKQTKIFSGDDNAVLRKFVIRVTVPFIIFRNLSHADIKAMDQLIPTSLAFVTITAICAFAVYWMRHLVSKDIKKSNSFCITSFIGNYSYLGWGVLYHFYGETGFTRGIFFTVFFWPFFLLIGFILTSALAKSENQGKSSIGTLISNLRRNALPPVLALTLGLCVNLLHLDLPQWFSKSVDSIAALTIPTILFSVGLSFSIIIKKEHIRPILSGAIFRTFFGIFAGIAAVLLVSSVFKVDETTKKVILLESVMPTATTSPFFVDFVDSDKEVVSGIITFSTLLAIFTLPFWYFIIEKWSSLI